MPGHACALRAHGNAPADRRDDQHEQKQHAPGAGERAQRDQRARRPGQHLMHLREYADDLRHDVGEQTGDDSERDERQQQRVGQRGPDPLVQRVARFAVIGQAREHLIQAPRLLAGRDRSAIDFRKTFRRVGQRGRQARAFHDARAQIDYERARTRVVVLLRQRPERFFDRQTGAQQRRELPRQQRQLRAAQPALKQ
jgi:hypothetical protein